jgi:hypothetical protein
VVRAIPFRLYLQIPLFSAVICFGSENRKALQTPEPDPDRFWGMVFAMSAPSTWDLTTLPGIFISVLGL